MPRRAAPPGVNVSATAEGMFALSFERSATAVSTVDTLATTAGAFGSAPPQASPKNTAPTLAVRGTRHATRYATRHAMMHAMRYAPWLASLIG
jgi:hypothetical protein